MNAQLFLSHFDRISDAPNAIPRLRQFVLDLAVRGKLEEQNPHDEAASVFLARVQEDKERRTQTGLLRKTQDHSSRYNDVGPGFPISPKPFVIPHSWIWAPFGRIVISRDAERVPVSESDRALRPKLYDYYGASGVIDKIDNYLFEKPLLLIGEDGANLVNRSTPIAFIARGKYWVNNHAHVLDGISETFLRFMALFINAIDLKPYLTGTAQPKMNQRKMNAIPVAVPPEAEQCRIVAKVDELMALCDQLEAAQRERESRRYKLTAAIHHHLNHGADKESTRNYARLFLSNFPRLTVHPGQIKAIRQTVLNLAVKGKLTRQDLNDEPAAKLLQTIRVQRRNINTDQWRQKPYQLPDIELSEAPFELPSGWTWARFPELGYFGRGKSKHRPRNDASLFQGGTHLLIQTGDVARSNGLITTHTSRYNEAGLAQSMKWPVGTLCITIAANIADSGILSFDACFPDSVVGFIPESVFPNARYFEYFIRTAKANLLEFAPATAQKNINLEILNAVLIPLPPLAEQQRIVEKVDELMVLCDQLETHLNSAESESNRLLKSVLYKALNAGTADDANEAMHMGAA